MVKRGETFTLLFGDSEMTPPLVFTNAFSHPFIILHIKSMKYPQLERYNVCRWFDCKNVIRFKEARISEVVGDWHTASIPDSDKGLENGVYTRVYHSSDDNKYFYLESQGKRKEYSFKFKIVFYDDDICDLIDDRYFCELSIVDGYSLKQELTNLIHKYGLEALEMDEMLQALQNINAPELDELELDAPLVRLSMNIPINQFEIIVEV